MNRRTQERLARLAGALPLDDVSDAELELIDGAGDGVAFPAGHLLARQDEVGREAFVLVAGEVEVRRDGERVAVLGPGDVAGELAVLGGGRRSADLVARTEVEAVVFDLASFQRAIHASDRLRHHVERAVVAHVA